MTNEQRAIVYRKLALPSLFYALCFGFILRGHLSGIGMPIFVMLTVVYCGYCMKCFASKRKIGTFIYMFFLLLLGISTCLTGNGIIQFLNGFLFFILLVCMQLHIYYDDRQWTLVKNFLAFFRSLFGCFECIGDLFIDRKWFRHKSKAKNHTKLNYILLGVGISIPLLAIVLALLSSADAIFSTVVKDIIGIHFNIGRWIGSLFITILVFVASYTGIRFHLKKKISRESPDMRTLEPLVGNTILTLISAVYLLFSGIQILYLFLGGGTLPEGYTYAEYAREGFFQLLFVCILNIGLVLFCIGLFKENKWMKFLLTVISLCTYIMLASSAFRMCMYVRQYHLTFLRIFVLWFLGLLSFALAGLICSIYSRRFRLLRYLTVVCSVCYILFSFSRPDYWIARYNTAAIPTATETVDLDYLASLSSDAAPVIAEYDDEWTKAYRKEMREDADENILNYNFSIRKALKLLEEDEL